MNPVDPKWLEILKASGSQTLALTLSFVVFIVLVKNEVISTESTLWITIPTLGALICGFLWLASIGDGIATALKPAARIDRWGRIRRDKRMVRDFIPHMTDADKAIIGYLLYHNQKMFQHDQDAGYAAPLLAKGIIRDARRPGQVCDIRRMPFEIPDHIWAVLADSRDEFPYEPPPGRETYPWAIDGWLK